MTWLPKGLLLTRQSDYCWPGYTETFFHMDQLAKAFLKVLFWTFYLRLYPIFPLLFMVTSGFPLKQFVEYCTFFNVEIYITMILHDGHAITRTSLYLHNITAEVCIVHAKTYWWSKLAIHGGAGESACVHLLWNMCGFKLRVFDRLLTWVKMVLYDKFA